MIYHLSKNNKTINGVLEIGGSKSESNRLLMLRKYLSDFKITNLSKSDDTKTLIDALINTNKIIDVNHAGTAMRFLLSYYASKPNSEVTLTVTGYNKTPYITQISIGSACAGYSAGDVNADSFVNVTDVVISVGIVLGTSPANECQMDYGDLNQDGTINISDIVLLVGIILG